MNITQEILQRYTSNNCTTAEREAVELWLDAEAMVGVNVVTADDMMAKDEMWANITAANTLSAKRRHRVVSITKYTAYAAACVAVFFGLLIKANVYAPGNDIVIDNLAGLKVKKVIVGQLEFTVEPGSSCDITQPWFGKERSVKFCGAVSVANISAKNSQLSINTGFASCSATYTDKVNLQKGQTYLAMTDDQYKFITATTDELNDGLPQPFSSRLHKRFNL